MSTGFKRSSATDAINCGRPTYKKCTDQQTDEHIDRHDVKREMIYSGKPTGMFPSVYKEESKNETRNVL